MRYHSSPVYTLFLLSLLLLSLYLAYGILSPFIHTIIFSIVLAAIFHPLFLFLKKKFNDKAIPAAITVILVIIFCILIPTLLFFGGIGTQAVNSVGLLTKWLNSPDFTKMAESSRIEPYLDWIHSHLPFINTDNLDIQGQIVSFTQSIGQTFLGWGRDVLANIVTIIIHFLLMIFFLFFLLKDGQNMVKVIKYLTPLRKEQEDAILTSLSKVSRAVLVGGLLIAAFQGLAGGVGFLLVGIPPLFWATMVGFASLIPIVGTGLIWVPAAAYLLIIGKWGSAIFLSLWFLVVVVSIDTFLRPVLLKGAAQISTFFIFVAVIGGLNYYGAAGLLYGPLILSLAVAMLKIYGEEYQDILRASEEVEEMEEIVPEASPDAPPDS